MDTANRTMMTPLPNALTLAVAAAMISSTALAQPDASVGNSKNGSINGIETTAVYGEPGKTKTATKLDLSILETPTLVSVVSRDHMDDFSLNQVSELLTYAPGVTVEQAGTDRTYYTARGFDIVNFQYDGVGVPLFNNSPIHGHYDTAIYEQVEVVKGASGLTTGLGHPSAIINYVRKRPTDELRTSVSASTGSWNRYRVESDVSGPILEEKLKGRLVVAYQDGDSYLDRYSKELAVFYGVISSDLTDHTRLTIGHSINDNRNNSSAFEGLTLPPVRPWTKYDVATNSGKEWTYLDVQQERTFAELEQDLSENWRLKAVVTQNTYNEEGLASSTWGYPNLYKNEETVKVANLSLNGAFSFWGQEHELAAGIDIADMKLESAWKYFEFPPTELEPDSLKVRNRQEERRSSYYVSSRLNLSDSLSILLGGRHVSLEPKDRSEDKYSGEAPSLPSKETLPYTGITYEVLDGTMLYASYSEVFEQQPFLSLDEEPLGPVLGESTEVGIKQEFFSGKALLTVARFQMKQENLGEVEGNYTIYPEPYPDVDLYVGVEVESSGFELELTGELATGLNLMAGYTQFEVEYEGGYRDGHRLRKHIPTKQFKLALGYQVPSLPALRVGSGIRWQNEAYPTYRYDPQEGYALVDLFAQYELTDNLRFAININNASDEVYRQSPRENSANYGAPTNAMASIIWQY